MVSLLIELASGRKGGAKDASHQEGSREAMVAHFNGSRKVRKGTATTEDPFFRTGGETEKEVAVAAAGGVFRRPGAGNEPCGSSKSTKPEEVIPLDDDELRDF